MKLISPILFSKYRRTGAVQVKHITKADLADSSWEVAKSPTPAFSSILSFTVAIGVVSITLLGTNFGSAVAQVPSIPNQMPLGEKTLSQVNVLFVNPSIGDNTVGNGNESAPLKTITQALQIAAPNTVIMLAKGTYSTDSGEVFPLMLKPGVAIQGDASSKGQGITIQGGGEFLSRSFGGQNVTIIGATHSELTGVTVTNSNPRGYGLWIESTNPVIAENTFTGNTQDGVSVNGNSATTISKNYFYRNGANGITLGGNSQAQVRENVFQQTGFGINITQNAAPVLVGNQIQDNRSGILVQGSARPILRNNVIQGSKEDGLVAIAQAMPDLGNATESGGNQFRNNVRYDINASAAKEAISAVGNTLVRVAGKVETSSQTALTTPTSNSTDITFAAPDVPKIINQPKVTVPNPIVRNNSGSGKINNQLQPLTTANAPLILPRYNQQPPAPIANNLADSETTIDTPAPTTKVTQAPAVQPDTPQLNYVQLDPQTIEFVAPQAQSPETNVSITPQSQPRVSNQSQSLPKLEISASGNTPPLPVPNSNIPVGNTRNMRKISVPQSNTTGYGGSYLSSANAGIRYRVVVDATSDTEQQLVRLYAPGAFSTVWQGRRVMQVGVFSSRNNADEMLKVLNSNGLRTIVEPLN